MILVVGGAGYIGSHMLKRLRTAGEPHLAFDSLCHGHKASVEGSSFVHGELGSRADLEQVFDTHPIDTVMHFASHIWVGESVSDPSKYYANNVVATLNLLEVMREREVKRFVFSSTAAIFGEPEQVPIDEAHPKRPESPYGESKWMIERILSDYDRAYGLKSVALRYFNAAGADPDGVLGEDHRPEYHLIPRAILAALGEVPPLQIFGTDYDTPDGTCVRDYIHILDLAEAHLLAVRHLREGGDSRQYNLGNGKGFSVREVVETVSRVLGQPVPHGDGPRRAGDPAVLVASSERIRTDWGWTPRYPELETLVRHAWAWRQTHPRGYEEAS